MSDDGKPGPTPQVSDQEILSVFENSSDPVLIASEVAECLSIGRRGVYDRLKDLESEGILESKKAGGRSTIWWFPGNTSTSTNEDG